MTIGMQIALALPGWVRDEVSMDKLYPGRHERIELAIELSRANVAHGSGGPFGAAVFDGPGRLLGVGVNQVLASNCSAAHAEVMALASSQQNLKRFRLNGEGGSITLATSAQPCAMCYGALIWAGIDEVLIGARSDDVQSLAKFDEGPLPADWAGELERRGVAVHRDLCRDEACKVLRDYGESGVVY
jgi:tRNA(Arg) A34 adenosine deaminase TadA